MCANEKFRPSRKNIFEFTYPVLHEGKDWYIDFTAFDPATGNMRRKKYMVKKLRSDLERRRRASEMLAIIINKLRSGWNPWILNSGESRSYISLEIVGTNYQQIVLNRLKPKTQRTYLSFLKVFKEYINSLAVPPKYSYQFTTGLIMDFLDHLTLDREVAGRTLNNYRMWLNSLGQFMVEREYISDNPVNHIKRVKESEKIRQPLNGRMLQQLRDYLSKENPYMLLACMMEYYTFIRPGELLNIRINDIRLKEQTVFISHKISKNKRDGKIALNDEVAKYMLEIGLFRYPGACYIFGAGMQPGLAKAEPQLFSRAWNRLRKHFNWGNEYQFYSLKDTGLRDLANSVGIVIARDQARHSDVSTTNIYLHGHDLPVHEETKHFKGAL